MHFRPRATRQTTASISLNKSNLVESRSKSKVVAEDTIQIPEKIAKRSKQPPINNKKSQLKSKYVNNDESDTDDGSNETENSNDDNAIVSPIAPPSEPIQVLSPQKHSNK